MFARRIIAVVAGISLAVMWIAGGAFAQIRIEVPERRSNPTSDGPGLRDLVGGLLALKDGYDRSRRGFVCALTYEDANANGARDRGEGPLPGWSFSIADAGGATVARGLTDAKGRFCNDSPLAPGAYTVTESPAAGWLTTEPAAGGLKSVVLPADQSLTVLFGNCRGERCARSGAHTPPPASPPPPTSQSAEQVCVTKYNDLNGNGVRDAGEPALPGWLFSLKTAGGAMLAFGSTDATGQWCSNTILTPGPANVFETPQPGWTSTDPANVPSGTAPSKPTTIITGQVSYLVFGNRTPRICVTKFNDLNGNGVRATSEPGLPGWTFTVKNSAGVVLDSGVTDAQGQWCTTQPLPVGAASVVETMQAGWVNTSPGGATPTRTMTLAAGQTWNGVFGNWVPPATGKVCVMKYRDLNSDGQQGGLGEPPQAGWQFTITGPSGPVTLTTGAAGTACTPANLAPGSYTVTETPQTGWTNTDPGNATASKVVNVSSAGVAQATFGNVPVAARILCVNKYQDQVPNRRYDVGEPLLAGWTFEVRNASGVLVATGVTNAQGRWCTAAPLPVGNYSVTEMQQPGWVVVDPLGPPNGSPPYLKPAILTATRGADLFFGNIRSGRVCLTKYNDLNGNGHRDPGEPPLAGFTFHFQYTSSSHATDVQLTTGPTGVVCLDLPPAPVTTTGDGNWVWELPKPGWVNTEPTPANPLFPLMGYVFPVVEGQTTNLAFGNHQASLSGRICVVKFNDLNGDGVKQSNEPLLTNWTFNITGPSGPLSGTTTPGNGQWCTLQTLLPGTYQVTETAKPGWVRTKPSGTAPQMPAVVTIGQTTTLTVGNHLTQAPARLCVTKYNDLNHNGVRDAGEPVMGFWPFAVRNAAGGLDDNGLTDLMGMISSDPDGVWCSVQPLAAGPVSVVETGLQGGWVSTDPGGTTPTKPVVLIAGQTVNVAFGNYHTPPAPGRVCVIKFNDLNGDGVRQSGEPTLPGWTFNLTGPSGPLTGITDPSGRWCTAQTLTPGAYNVAETLVTGWTSTAPGGLAPHLPATVTAGGTTVLSFGNRLTPPPGSVCLTKYSDLDHDGVRDSGEPGLPGWVFNLETAAGVSAGSLTTGANGKACIELPAGPYNAFEVTQAGWANTDPTGANPQKPFTIVSNQTVNIVFGNHQKPPPVPMGKLCVAKSNDLNGDGAYSLNEPMLPGWQFQITGPSGPITLTTGPDGRACTDANLLLGTYVVTEVAQPGWVATNPTGANPHVSVVLTATAIPSVHFSNHQVPPPQLSIEKFSDNLCTGSAPNVNCIFRVRIHNNGGATYAGPASFTDRVLINATAIPGVSLAGSPPPGWSCSGAQPSTCTATSVSIAGGGFIDVVFTLTINGPVLPDRNCVSLTAPIAAGPGCVPLP